MRLLNLTNFYPPHARGGYEAWCEEVTNGLRARGHTVSVLTSRFRCASDVGPDPSWVHRDLHLEMDLAPLRNVVRFFTLRQEHERANLDRLSAWVDALDPDCILVWGMWNLHRALPALAERLRPNRVAYYFGDYWPTLPSQYQAYWTGPARNWVTAVLKTPLRRTALREMARDHVPTLELRHAMFATAFVRDELSRLGVRAADGRVVYGAIETQRYARRQVEPSGDSDRPRLLWVGRLTADKGPDTAIEALALLVRDHGLSRASLVVVGGGDASCERSLRRLALELGVGDRIQFVGAQPKDAMPAFYRGADVFLFTSRWPEPFGRTLIEAMASGLAVVATAVGGAREILADGQNAVSVESGDAAALASGVTRVVRDSHFRDALVTRARQDALTTFDIGRMTTDIEMFLQRVLDGDSSGASSRPDVH